MLTCFCVLVAAAAQAVPGGNVVDRNRIDRAPAPVPRAPAPDPSVAVTTVAAGSAAPITGIRFQGAEAPAPVAAAARRFIGRRASRETLGELAAALSAAYRHSDVALYTVSIAQQDFSRGIVAVTLTEGRITRVELKGDDAAGHPQLQRRLAPLTEEAPLTRATFERQLTLARAIPGLTLAGTDFTEPLRDGTLVLAATPTQRSSRLTAGFSNRGVASLGDGQFDVRGEVYGVTTDGDALALSVSAASDLKRYRYASLGYSAPLGGDGLTAAASAAYLETRPDRLPIRGTAKQANLSLAYPLIRGFTRSADVSLGLDGLDSENAAFGNVIATERTRAARAAASYATAAPRRSASFSASLSHGLDVLGARVARGYAEDDFTKATATASLAQAVGSRATVRLTATGQYSRDKLPAAELFGLGGEAIGRGFDTSVLTGDRGAGGVAELAWRPVAKGSFATSELYGFVDGGTVTAVSRAAFAETSYGLASTGVGVRARFRTRAELGLEAARVIDDPYAGYRGDWRLSVAWRVTG